MNLKRNRALTLGTNTNGNYVLGGSRFEKEIAATLKRRVARGKAGRPKKTVVERGQLRLIGR